MKKIFLTLAAFVITAVAFAATPEYKSVEAKQVDLKNFTTDKDGYVQIFNGKDFTGWRGYGKTAVPSRWKVVDGCISFTGSGTGEGQTLEGGDIIFAHKFKNFTFEFEWKVAKGANSGVFYLAQEITTKKDGKERYEPIYISAPEYQILDNANHPDSFLGEDGNRKSASLYDMIPAKPQNQKPYGEWNTGKIIVYNGTVIHYQNGKKVLEYHLWTQQWTDMLQASKFSEKAWPLAYALLNNCGGDKHEGYIGFQDHGDNVMYRNIRIKESNFDGAFAEEKDDVCFQMYSVRELIGNPELYAKNQADALPKLAKMGYTHVEAANYNDGKLYGVTPEQFKADVEAAGLKVLSSHTGRGLNQEEINKHDFKAALQWWDVCIDAHKRAGAKYIVFPGMFFPKDLAGMKVVCEYMNEVGKKVAAAGMKLGYHSHSHEFKKIENEVILDYMLKNTDPQYVFFQLDVYWAVVGGVSPVEYFKNYPGRFAMLHIKDKKELGQSGMVGFDAIYRNLGVAGTQDCVVELEEVDSPTILDGMRACINYLKDSGFVK